MKPYLWMERPSYKFPARNIYGPLIWCNDSAAVYGDENLYACYEEEQLVLTTRDDERMRKFMASTKHNNIEKPS